MLRKLLLLGVSALLVVAVLFVAQAFGVNPASLTSQVSAAPAAATPTPSVAFVSAPAASANGSLALMDLYRKVNSSVVEVVNLADGGRYSSVPVEQSLGSGFVWDDKGYIVTNDHVVEGADVLQVLFDDGTRVNATLVGTDPSSDLAVIKVDPAGLKLHPIAQGNMNNVVVGQDVVAIGNPYGFQGTMTTGIVSGLGRTISSQTDFSIPNAIQTDAAINPGNSGGPLLDGRGEVIGVNDQIESSSGSSSGVGFAIPISIVQRVVPALIQDGKYQHPYLGISANTYNSTWAKDLNLPADAKGVYIMDVVQGGPAQQAGLRGGTKDSGILLSVGMRGPSYLPAGGDLIIAINGQEVNSMDALMTYLSEHTAPGDTVTLTVVRAGGEQSTLDVKLGVQPTNLPLSQTS